ncbi:oligopeptide transporter 8 [Colletotrichum higginsianum]|nr:oligopeptide transporter 8 [Colletotrichum higginsianum]
MANTKASVVSTSAVDDDAPSSVAATGRGVDASKLDRPRVLEDDKSDDGLKTNDPSETNPKTRGSL